ncbi:MAG: hypothetical protein QW483_01465 [Nanopusillaceae archaeon]
MIKLFSQIFIEIIVIVIILLSLFYILSGMARFAVYEEIKYKDFVKFLEEKITKGETGMFEDYVIYNPLKYSIFFNFSNRRIELIKCETYESFAYFYKSGQFFVRNFSDGCVIIYRTKELKDFDSWNISIIVLRDNTYIYTLSEATTYYVGPGVHVGTTTTMSCAVINISKPKPTEIYIDESTEIKDISSIFLGPKDKLYDGYCISYCTDKDKCKIDYEKLTKESLISYLSLTSLVDSSARQIKIFVR